MSRYVDADKINAELMDEYHGMISDESMKIYKIILMLDNAPTADVQGVRHGAWRESLSDMFPDGTDYRCSVCGRTAILDSEYCPNCGAKMDLEG